MSVYQGRPGLTGQSQFSRRHDGQWFHRRVPFTRNGTGKPDSWEAVNIDLNLALNSVIDPDAMPKRIDCNGIVLHRLSGLGVRLPHA